jgi:hypothetical protein
MSILGIFEFNEDDLKSNQNGFITTRQKERIESFAQGMERTSKTGFWIVIGFLPFPICLILALFMQNESTRKVFFAGPGVYLALCGAAAFAVLAMGFGIYLARRRAEGLRESGLLTAEGTARLDETHGKYGTTYLVYFDDRKFSFGEDMSEIFREGGRYKVYYCKTSMLEYILSYSKIG